jgi:sulfate transport system ATP-binding protein
LRSWLRHLHDEVPVTSVFVTHDQVEALELADTVVVMNNGRVEQTGTPQEIYERPVNPFVYNFIGTVNPFHGRVDRGLARIENFQIGLPEFREVRDRAVVAFARPHEIEVGSVRTGPEEIEARVCYIHRTGPLVHLELERLDTRKMVEVELSHERFTELGAETGSKVFIRLGKMRVFLEED